MRTIRELATIHCLRQGHLPVHAASFAIDRRACVLIGPKKSGKTTLLLSSLLARDATFMGNDRVMLQPVNGMTLVRAMPTIIRIRARSLHMFPKLAQRQLRWRYDREYTCAEAEAIRLNQRRDGTAQLSGAQLCRLTDAETTGPSPLASLVFPRLVTDVSQSELIPIGADEAASALFQSIVLGGRPHRLSEFFCDGERGFPTNVESLRHLCRQCVEGVRCWRYLVKPAVCLSPPSPLGRLRAA